MDTIFAQATARGKAGVAVIRISGPGARPAGQGLAGALPPSRRAGLRRLTSSSGVLLDEALVLFFPEGSSFTGEDIVELHCHGGQATIAAILRELGQMEGLRLAEPGEFTRRALQNGCLDLSQVEGLSDLLDAETEAQRKQALRIFSGSLAERIEAWRGKLIRAAALLAVVIDFSDEEVPEDVRPEVLPLIRGVLDDLGREIQGVGAAERIREGFEVAIVGPPNAGKSTLLNALAGREAAITSEHAGTTRDVIEVRMDLAGLPVTFLDTAGLRETVDAIETIGIKRAVERARAADLRVFLQDDLGAPLFLEPGPGDILVLGKADLRDTRGFAVSGETGAGLETLISRITSVLETRAGAAGTATRERHRQAMGRARIAIEAAQARLESGLELVELAAEDLNSAIRSLESVVGRIDVETVLDEIFGSFCLGK
ncbi:tRNA modification GTPase trmE [Rhodovulum imhoffii]|uniref:tRNA modification GTPase MnmE n=1 Tax=Rhodovulum imhoffii TaxID=365340 RepID=A0A2T5BRM4_9RHOB|nr:tRNA uridine-5-carboxymethylaminomethyl(34) synthesis GTPase MnmE [Rhodovulum imhoffii]MBK5934032.1 tRNA uridine-5-carboxymethylaminomethyl(34) synthesis GTPase MnmE [Rhodovulum imhoffii]PTN01917.1 tRNA modification GTPase trmE [Rhodovulum imhoffii]